MALVLALPRPREKMLVIVIAIPTSHPTLQGGLPNGKSRFTTCHLREHQRIQPACQRYVFSPHCFPRESKAPHPQGTGKSNGCGLNSASATKEAVVLPDSQPWGTVILEQKAHEHVRVQGMGQKEPCQSSFRGEEDKHPAPPPRPPPPPPPGKAVLDWFGDLGTKIPVVLVFWFSVELFS